MSPEVTDSNQRGRGNSHRPKWLTCGDPRVTHRKARATCRNGFTSILTTDSGLVLFRAAKKSRFLAHAQDPCFAVRRPAARRTGENARLRQRGPGGDARTERRGPVGRVRIQRGRLCLPARSDRRSLGMMTGSYGLCAAPIMIKNFDYIQSCWILLCTGIWIVDSILRIVVRILPR